MRTNKHSLTILIVLMVLLLLILHEASSWRHFNWATFWKNTQEISLAHAGIAIAITYLGFLLRAVRWRVFLKPRRAVATTRLLGPTIVGFSALALLGRPGEFVRPYLIARREELSLSSQVAVLLVERVFDLLSAGLLIMVALVFSPGLSALPHMAQLQKAIAIVSVLIMMVAFALLLLARRGEKLGIALQQALSPISTHLAKTVNYYCSVFSRDLDVIRDTKSLVQVIALSVITWLLSGFSCLETIHAFAGARYISLADAMLLLGFGVVGSLIQLPGGGSQQLIAIAALTSLFGLSAELAVSCSILGWLTIFMAPVPIGLILLRNERLTFTSVSRTAEQDAAIVASS